MANNSLNKSDSQLVKNFRSSITELENKFKEAADGKNIIVGTSDSPIIPNSDLCASESIFADGVYAREMFVKQGSVVIGAIHKHEHISFLMSGHLTVVDENGASEHKAPSVIVAGAGIKRVAYAHEDTIWYNVHGNPTNTEDLKELEKEIIVASYEEYEEYIKNK
jgi:hypothetical protein